MHTIQKDMEGDELPQILQEFDDLLDLKVWFKEMYDLKSKDGRKYFDKISSGSTDMAIQTQRRFIIRKVNGVVNLKSCANPLTRREMKVMLDSPYGGFTKHLNDLHTHGHCDFLPEEMKNRLDKYVSEIFQGERNYVCSLFFFHFFFYSVNFFFFCTKFFGSDVCHDRCSASGRASKSCCTMGSFQVS